MPKMMQAKIPTGYRVVTPKPGQPMRSLVLDFPNGSSEAFAFTDENFRAMAEAMLESLRVGSPKQSLDS